MSERVGIVEDHRRAAERVRQDQRQRAAHPAERRYAAAYHLAHLAEWRGGADLREAARAVLERERELTAEDDGEPGLAGRTFQVTAHRRGGDVIIVVRGEIDALAEPAFHDYVRERSGARVVFDLADLTFIDSAGLQVLLDAHRRGPAAYCGLTPRVARLFDLLGLRTRLKVYDSVDDAFTG